MSGRKPFLLLSYTCGVSRLRSFISVIPTPTTQFLGVSILVTTVIITISRNLLGLGLQVNNFYISVNLDIHLLFKMNYLDSEIEGDAVDYYGRNRG